MSFSRVYLTAQGQRLQALTLTGGKLHFTRLQIGDGASNDPVAMTALVSPVADVSLTLCRINTDNTVTIGGPWDNSQITEAFVFRELGLWAQDPDDPDAEVLYAYAYATEGPQTISTSNGEIIQKTIRLNVALGNDSTVTATLVPALCISREDMVEYAAPLGHGHTATEVTETTGRTVEEEQRRQDEVISFILQSYGGSTFAWGFADNEIPGWNIARGALDGGAITTGGDA